MLIRRAEFAGSSPDVSAKPKDKLPEFAFIGRSNVGKSSLINYLCGAQGLAKTSSTPGKTLLINHFKVDGSWYLVDLPGYGFARKKKKKRKQIDSMIKNYILNSDELVLLFVLLDSRHDLQKIDLQFLTMLGEQGIPFSIIFTKSDKLGKKEIEEQTEKNKKALLEYWEELPPVFVTSSEKKTGKEAILDYIEDILKSI